jgi:hypothetical protein
MAIGPLVRRISGPRGEQADRILPSFGIAAVRRTVRFQRSLAKMSTEDRLAESTFASLDAMMEAYAAEAARVARSQHGVKLDFSEASVERLEQLLSSLESVPADRLEYVTRLWGSYFGEVLRRRYGAAWTMTVYPGSDLAVPTIEVRGSRLYPLSKVHRRLSMGDGESVLAFYRMVTSRLGDEVKLN